MLSIIIIIIYIIVILYKCIHITCVFIYFRNLYEIEDCKLLCLVKVALSTLDRKLVIKYEKPIN